MTPKRAQKKTKGAKASPHTITTQTHILHTRVYFLLNIRPQTARVFSHLEDYPKVGKKTYAS